MLWRGLVHHYKSSKSYVAMISPWHLSVSLQLESHDWLRVRLKPVFRVSLKGGLEQAEVLTVEEMDRKCLAVQFDPRWSSGPLISSFYSSTDQALLLKRYHRNKQHNTTVAECGLLPARWRCVVASAIVTPPTSSSVVPPFCGDWEACCGAQWGQCVAGASLRLVLINFILQPLTTCV